MGAIGRTPDKFDKLAQKSVDSLTEHFRENGKRGLLVQSTTNRSIQRFGGDLLIIDGERHWLCEVKADDTEYVDTLFCEYLADAITNESGWLMVCQADYLFYHWHLTNKVVRFNPDQLRKLLFEEGKVTGCKVKMQSKYYTNRLTFGYSVPIEMIKDLSSFKEFSLGNDQTQRMK